MYKYTFSKTNAFSSEAKKNLRSIAHAIMLCSIVLDIISFITLFFIFRLLNIFSHLTFFIICLTIILLQCIIIFIKSKNYLNKCLSDFEPIEYNISFDEDGFKVFNYDVSTNVNWNNIKEVIVFDDKFSITYAISGIRKNTYYFNSFEVSKDTIISDIEKYKKVRCC